MFKNTVFLSIALSVVLILGGLLMFSVTWSISDGQVGVVRHWGEVTEILPTGGPYFNWILTHSVELVDVRTQEMDLDFSARSFDSQQVSGLVSIHYNVVPTEASRVVQQFGNMEMLNTLVNSVFTNEIQNVLSTKTAMEINAERPLVASQMLERLQQIQDQYYINVSQVNIESLNFTEGFDSAIESRVIAEQEMMRAELEAQRALIYAQQQLDVRKLEMDAMLLQANTEAEALRVLQGVWGSSSPEMRDIMLRQQAIEKWSGDLPLVVGDDFGLILNDLLN